MGKYKASQAETSPVSKSKMKNAVFSVFDIKGIVHYEFVLSKVLKKHAIFTILKFMVVHSSTKTLFDIMTTNISTQHFQ